MVKILYLIILLCLGSIILINGSIAEPYLRNVTIGISLGYSPTDPLPIDFSYGDTIKIIPYYLIYENYQPTGSFIPTENDNIIIWFKFISSKDLNLTNESIVLLAYLVEPPGNIQDNPIIISSLERGDYLKNVTYVFNEGLGIDSATPGLWKVKYVAIKESELDKFYNLSDTERANYIGFKTYNIHIFTWYEKMSIYLIMFSICVTFFATIIGLLIGWFLSETSAKRKKKEERRSALIALIYEIQHNMDYAKEINSKHADYAKRTKVPFQDFIVINLERILSGDYINSPDLLNLLFDYYDSLKTMNEFLKRLRLPNLPKGINDIDRVLEIVEVHTSHSKMLISKIKKLL